MATNPINKVLMKTSRQLRKDKKTPYNATPNKVPNLEAVTGTAKARPRSSGEKTTLNIALELAETNAPPTPPRPLQIINCVKSPEVAASKFATVITTSPIKNTKTYPSSLGDISELPGS